MQKVSGSKSSYPPLSDLDCGLFLGNEASSTESKLLKHHNIKAVISILHLSINTWRQDWYREIIPKDSHLYIPCNDSSTQDLLPQLASICNFIDKARGPNRTNPVLVHCQQGVSRSATVMIAYLMRAYGWSYSKALQHVSDRRRIKPNDNFKEQLQVWEEVGFDVWQADGTPKPEYAAYLARRAERLQELGLTGDEPIGIQNL